MIEHRAKNLCRQDQAGRVWVDGDIPSHEAHVCELLNELLVLLIAQGLQWGSVYDLWYQETGWVTQGTAGMVISAGSQ